MLTGPYPSRSIRKSSQLKTLKSISPHAHCRTPPRHASTAHPGRVPAGGSSPPEQAIVKQPTVPQPRGFQPSTFAPPRPTRPTPLPKRPKGRWFVGLLLLGFVAFAAHEVWSSYFRYQAYGSVACTTVEVSPPWDGVVIFVHHRKGDRVPQGELLMTVQSLELRQRVAQIADELSVEQAKLEAEAARIKWESAYGLDQNRGALVNYYEAYGAVLQEEAKLEEFTSSLARAERPSAKGTIAGETVEKLRFAKQGQAQKIEMLKEAVAELKRRADEAGQLLDGGTGLIAAHLEYGREQLKPNLARIAALQAERARLQERLAQGEIRSPVNGIVLKHLAQVGESCKANEAVVSLLDEESLQVVLYLKQADSTAFAPNCEMDVEFDPYDQPLRCTLVRLGDQFEPAPEHLKRYYSEGAKLLPVYLEPAGNHERWMVLRENSVVRLARTARCAPALASR